MSAISADAERETLPEGCIRESWELQSPSMGKPIPVVVLLPPGGDSPKPLPVLFALHGSGGPTMHKTYSEMAPLREYLADHPMLVVSFYAGENSGYIDSPIMQDSKYTTFFFDELLPEIAKRYRTTGELGVTGFSMGGFGAMHYLLERPGVFSAVSSMSGAFELFKPDGESERWRKFTIAILGEPSEHAADYARVQLAPRFSVSVESKIDFPPLLFLCGSEDKLKEGNRRFVDLLAGLNAQLFERYKQELEGLELEARRKRIAEIRSSESFQYEYRETPGAHDWPYWRGHVKEIAEFHWQHFAASHPAE